jgi:hypothetical protein
VCRAVRAALLIFVQPLLNFAVSDSCCSGFTSGDFAHDTLSIHWVTQASGAMHHCHNHHMHHCYHQHHHHGSSFFFCGTVIITTITGLSPPTTRPCRSMSERILLAFVHVVCARSHAPLQCAGNDAYAVSSSHLSAARVCSMTLPPQVCHWMKSLCRSGQSSPPLQPQTHNSACHSHILHFACKLLPLLQAFWHWHVKPCRFLDLGLVEPFLMSALDAPDTSAVAHAVAATPPMFLSIYDHAKG